MILQVLVAIVLLIFGAMWYRAHKLSKVDNLEKQNKLRDKINFFESIGTVVGYKPYEISAALSYDFSGNCLRHGPTRIVTAAEFMKAMEYFGTNGYYICVKDLVVCKYHHKDFCKRDDLQDVKVLWLTTSCFYNDSNEYQLLYPVNPDKYEEDPILSEVINRWDFWDNMTSRIRERDENDKAIKVLKYINDPTVLRMVLDDEEFANELYSKLIEDTSLEDRIKGLNGE